MRIVRSVLMTLCALPALAGGVALAQKPEIDSDFRVPKTPATIVALEGLASESVERRARKGERAAQIELGARLEQGRGLARDREAAKRWYRRALQPRRGDRLLFYPKWNELKPFEPGREDAYSGASEAGRVWLYGLRRLTVLTSFADPPSSPQPPDYEEEVLDADGIVIDGKLIYVVIGDEDRLCALIAPAYAVTFKSPGWRCIVLSYFLEGTNDVFRSLRIDVEDNVDYFLDSGELFYPGTTISLPFTSKTGAACGRYKIVAYTRVSHSMNKIIRPVGRPFETRERNDQPCPRTSTVQR